MKRNLYIFYCFLFFSAILFAQEEVSYTWEVYKDERKNPLSNTSNRQEGTIVALLQINSDTPKHWFKKESIQVLRILDKQNYIIALGAQQFKTLKKKQLLTPVNHKWKLSHSLIDSKSSRKTDYIIKSKDIDKTLDYLVGLSAIKVLKKSKNLIYVRTRQKILMQKLLPRSEVVYIGKESLNATLESTVRDLNPTVNTINKVQQEFPQLRGEGITISLKDNKFIETDIDLRDKLTNSPLISQTVDNHATDMATIIAGLGNSSIKGRGMAPGATLQLSNFANLFPDGNTYLTDQGIFVQNHSYGTEIENFYGILANAYDSHIYENPKELHIFSSGNKGLNIPENGLYKDIGTYANLSGNFKMSKNSLSIGAANEEGQVSSFSSVGPAYDGRIKPELTAYSIIGTSNAAATTSGVAALLQEYYLTVHGENPLASLLKATLINSARDIGLKGPDFRSGYGNLDAYNALKILENNHIIIGTVSQDTEETFTIELPQNAKNFKATLSWTDPPAEVNSNLALTNDLNLSLSIEGNTYLPWVLNSDANSESLNAIATQGIDHLNTVEQVFLETPNSDVVTLKVTGFDLATDQQEFSIAYSWEESDNFTWNYPLANDNFPYDGETASYLRWSSNFDNETGEISISYNQGVTWETISSDTGLSKGYYLWSLPEDTSTIALLKMTIEQNEFISDSFVISNVSTLDVALNCDSTLQLRWNKQRGVEQYNIYNLKENTMQLTAIATDTTYVFDKAEIDSNYFSVQSVLPNGRLGVRSTAIDFSVSEVGCYESFIIAQVSDDEKTAQLNITLNSIFEVAKIEIEKKIGETFTNIGILQNLDRTNPIYLDREPSQGLNTYRIKVILNDGRSFVSEESELFFLTTLPFITFPNPVTDGINVFTKNLIDTEVWLEIYNLNGKFVLAKKVSSDRAFILLNELRQGLYALTIYSNKGDQIRKLIYKL